MDWEVFIAYHGSYDEKRGSIDKAREIYNLLDGQNGINCYFYPECGNGKISETPDNAAHSRLFLLVANSEIRNKLDSETGEILPSEPIYEEMDAFYRNKMLSNPEGLGCLRVYCYGGYKGSEADAIDPVATKKVEHFDEQRDGGEEIAFTKLLHWVKTGNPCANSKDARANKLSASKSEKTSQAKQNKLVAIKCTERFQYFFSQYAGCILSAVILFLSIILFLANKTTISEQPGIVWYWILIGLFICLSFAISSAINYYAIGFRKIFCSSIFGEPKPQNILKTARRRIRFLGLASAKWLRDEKAFKDALRRLCSDDCGGIEFLLLNPESEDVKRMDLGCRPGQPKPSDTIKHCLNTIKRIVKEVCDEKGISEIKGFTVKLYSHYPIYRIIIADDDRMYLSFYSPGANGNNKYQIKVKGNNKNYIYPCLVNYYNQMWNDPATIPYELTKRDKN